LTSKEVDVSRVIAGGAAIRESTLQDERVLAEGFGADYYDAIIAILSNAAPLSEGAGGEEMIQAVGTELSEAVAGTKSVEDALKDANDAINSIQG
jgi:ABC-type glycerol-3-phosphate transport system substrate-binding protein